MQNWNTKGYAVSHHQRAVPVPRPRPFYALTGKRLLLGLVLVAFVAISVYLLSSA